jgi:hypothetical protein
MLLQEHRPVVWGKFEHIFDFPNESRSNKNSNSIAALAFGEIPMSWLTSKFLSQNTSA